MHLKVCTRWIIKARSWCYCCNITLPHDCINIYNPLKCDKEELYVQYLRKLIHILSSVRKVFCLFVSMLECDTDVSRTALCPPKTLSYKLYTYLLSHKYFWKCWIYVKNVRIFCFCTLLGYSYIRIWSRLNELFRRCRRRHHKQHHHQPQHSYCHRRHQIYS